MGAQFGDLPDYLPFNYFEKNLPIQGKMQSGQFPVGTSVVAKKAGYGLLPSFKKGWLGEVTQVTDDKVAVRWTANQKVSWTSFASDRLRTCRRRLLSEKEDGMAQ